MKLTRLSLASVAVAIATCSGSVKSAENSSPLVGIWRVTSDSVLTLETDEVSYPFGENPSGYLQYSPGGHMIVFIQKGNLQKPSSAIYTDAYRAQIHKEIIAYAGTYSVEGNKVTHHIVAAWLPHWIGDDQVRYAEISGNKLTIKTAPSIFALTGKQVVSTLTFEKVE
jgi:hypothetical protein